MPQNKQANRRKKKMYSARALNSTNQYGWNTTSQDYLEHLKRMERTPTKIIDVPQYPFIHNGINNSVAREEEHEDHRYGKESHKNHQKQKIPEVHKTVQFVEYEKTINVDKGMTESYEVKSINTEAGDFISRKHKIFELSKWGTFKGY